MIDLGFVDLQPGSAAFLLKQCDLYVLNFRLCGHSLVHPTACISFSPAVSVNSGGMGGGDDAS